jgi:glucose-fructose oxidoreductase
MKTVNPLTRRSLLKKTAETAVAAAAFPTIVPSSVLGFGPSPAPGDRIGVGCIGVGPQGTGGMRQFLAQKDARVLAVCDVKEEQLRSACDRVNAIYESKDCAAYKDYRELVARKDIDAVLIATPDHWHTLTALAALRAGKDVYCEKPLGLSLAEHQLLREEISTRKRIFQFGTQQRSDARFRRACEMVLNGRIGKLRHINVWAPGSAPGGSTKVVPVPETLDYDFWTGPAPYRPYTEDRCSAVDVKKTWWFISDYTLGFITGWGIHPMDIALWGGGADLFAGPLEAEGYGRIPDEGACNTATIWDVSFTFRGGATLKFVGTPNGRNSGEPTGEPWPQEQEWKNHYGRISTHGTAFEGTDGWVYVDRSGVNAHPASLLDENPETYKVQLKRSTNHVRDFLDSVKSRAPSICPIEDAIRADQLCHVADLALRLRRRLVWDPQKERFSDDSEAQERIASRNMRSPWLL